MFTDDQTARDLELFSAQHEGRSVFDLIDLTATHLGTRALRARLSRPHTDVESIRPVQQAVRFLAELDLRLPLTERLVTQVERYLDSTYQTTVAAERWIRRFESLWVALRYRNSLRVAREGVELALSFLRTIEPVVRQLRQSTPPPLLETILTQLEESVARLMWEPSTGGSWRVLELDRRFRSVHESDFRALLDSLGELDALMAMAHGLADLDLKLPEVVDSEAFVLEAEAVRHPFLTDPVSNPVSVSGGETLVFLTGPNMAGKTTYLKAVGIAMHMAHCGMGVAADAMRFAPVQGLITSLRPEDNLREGLSFFLAEVRRVRRVAEYLASGRRAFVIFDEIFRGTNVRDALEASKIVIKGFGRAHTSGFVISSHLTELADELEHEPSVRFAYFDGDIIDGVAQYSFRIHDGVSRKRFGLQLLEQEQVPRLLAAIPA